VGGVWLIASAYAEITFLDTADIYGGDGADDLLGIGFRAMSSGATTRRLGEHRRNLVMARLKPQLVPPEQLALRAALKATAGRRGGSS